MDHTEWHSLESIFDVAGVCATPSLLEPDEQHDVHMIDASKLIRHNLSCSPPSQVLVSPVSDTDATTSAGENPTQNMMVKDIPQSTIMSISTTFHPAANILPSPTDLILISSDKVLFYVHTTQVLAASTNHFNDTVLPQLLDDSKPDEVDGEVQNPIVHVPESSVVLNVILHSAYGIPCEKYKPSLDVLVAAVDAMPSYGLSPKTLVAPTTTLYNLILAQAPIRPLHVYALASRHDLYELAKAVSSFLLSFPLSTLSDECAGRIAPVYLKKLYVLYASRLDALKRLLSLPPHIHPATPECDFAEQKKLARAWALASAYLAWEATADLSPSAIQNALSPLANRLSCNLCQGSLADRIKQLLAQWALVQRTI